MSRDLAGWAGGPRGEPRRVLRGGLQAEVRAGGADQRQLQPPVCGHPLQQVHGLLHHPGGSRVQCPV